MTNVVNLIKIAMRFLLYTYSNPSWGRLPADSKLYKKSNLGLRGKAGFILDCGLAGFPQFGKKNLKFTLPRQMGRKKIDPRISTTFFYIKYSKTSLTTTLIWWPLYKLTLNFYSLLLSQLPFSSLFESLFQETNIQDSEIIRAQAFSVAQNVPKWCLGSPKHEECQ